MPTSMLNIRLDKSLKEAGERVLAQYGVSATEAVRGLYRHLQQTKEVPDFCLAPNAQPSPEERRRKMRHVIGIAKLAPGKDVNSLKRERLSRIEL